MCSRRWRAGERIVIADHAYPGVKNAARFVAERFGLELVEARVPWPLPGPEAVAAAAARRAPHRGADLPHRRPPLGAPLGAGVQRAVGLRGVGAGVRVGA